MEINRAYQIKVQTFVEICRFHYFVYLRFTQMNKDYTSTNSNKRINSIMFLGCRVFWLGRNGKIQCYLVIDVFLEDNRFFFRVSSSVFFPASKHIQFLVVGIKMISLK